MAKCIKMMNSDEFARVPDEVAHSMVRAKKALYCSKSIWRNWKKEKGK